MKTITKKLMILGFALAWCGIRLFAMQQDNLEIHGEGTKDQFINVYNLMSDRVKKETTEEVQKYYGQPHCLPMVIFIKGSGHCSFDISTAFEALQELAQREQ